jgi:hypothetical protein
MPKYPYISEHFEFKELTASKSFPDLVSANRRYFLLEPYLTRLTTFAEYMLEAIRFDIDGPLMINSCARCPQLNKAVGGTDKSQHQFDMPGPGAADIWTPVMSIEKLFELIQTKTEVCWHQLRVYPHRHFIHISMPTGKNDGQVKIVLDRIPAGFFMDHAEGDR